MIEIVTDMIGKTVEVNRWDNGLYLYARGVLRAAYATTRGVALVVEAMAGVALCDLEGELATVMLADFRVRVVERCYKCLSWAHASELEIDEARVGIASDVRWHTKTAKNTCRVAICKWNYIRVLDCTYCQGRACVRHPEVAAMFTNTDIMQIDVEALAEICKCNEVERHEAAK